MARIPGTEIERLKQEISLQRLAESQGIELKRHGADLCDPRRSRVKLRDGMLEAFEADLRHSCRGRSAPDRLRRDLRLCQ